MLLVTLLAAAALQAAPPAAGVSPEVRQALICSRGTVVQTPTSEPLARPGVRPLGREPDAHQIRTVLRNHCHAEDVRFNVSDRRQQGAPSPIQGKVR